MAKQSDISVSANNNLLLLFGYLTFRPVFGDIVDYEGASIFQTTEATSKPSLEVAPITITTF